MKSLLCHLLAATAASSLLLAVTAASADVAPPDDQKSVSYSFALHGLTSTDRVVFAYPCGTSNGAPKDEIRLLENDKPISVGRRGGTCTLYMTEKSKYDAFAKTYVPSDKSGTDDALAAFAAKGTKCTGAPSPTFVIAKTDTRTEIVEYLDVQQLDASECKVATRSAPTSQPDNSANDTGAIAPGSGSGSNDSGGCSVGGNARDAAPWLVALAVPIIVFGSRRRRKA